MKRRKNWSAELFKGERQSVVALNEIFQWSINLNVQNSRELKLSRYRCSPSDKSLMVLSITHHWSTFVFPPPPPCISWSFSGGDLWIPDSWSATRRGELKRTPVMRCGSIVRLRLAGDAGTDRERLLRTLPRWRQRSFAHYEIESKTNAGWRCSFVAVTQAFATVLATSARISASHELDWSKIGRAEGALGIWRKGNKTRGIRAKVFPWNFTITHQCTWECYADIGNQKC